METNRSSETAESAAATRALETLRPSEQRLLADPDAVHFLSAKNRLLVALTRSATLRRWVTRHYDTIFPGVMGEFVYRTRFIDQALLQGVSPAPHSRPAATMGRDERASAIRQVVLIGAGFDTRARRLTCGSDVVFFEVDHPATQARKRAVLGGLTAGGASVRYVPLDLQREPLSALTGHGFAPGLPAFFVLEGLLYYLQPAAADALLRAVVSLSAPGSQIVFNFLDAAYLPGGLCHGETGQILQHVGRIGEPFLFALSTNDLAGFLRQLGLQQIEHMRVTQYASSSSPPCPSPYRLTDMFQTVLARPAIE